MSIISKSLAYSLVLAIAPTYALVVPFEGITLNPNRTIQADYAFGPHPIIFCYENNQQSVGIVTWPYKGKIYSSTLSVSLKTNVNYQGQFADTRGTISITNNLKVPLIVNCDFGF